MKRILCFGDSNTYGYIPGGLGRYENGVRWTTILDRLVRDEGYSIIEEGLCGRTTVFEDTVRKGRKGTAALPSLLNRYEPDAVVVMLGTNDCKKVYHATSDIITSGMEQLVIQAKKFNKDLPIVIISPIEIAPGVSAEECDPDFGEEAADLSKELPDKYRALAGKYNTGYFEASKYAFPSDVDKEHMDAEGHRSFALGLESYIRSYLAS